MPPYNLNHPKFKIIPFLKNNFPLRNRPFVVAQFIAPRTFLSSIDIPLNYSMLNGTLYIIVNPVITYTLL